MMTIKFQHQKPLDPFISDEPKKPVRHVPVTNLEKCDESIRHEPFIVKSIEEYNKWRKDFLPKGENCFIRYVNNDPATQLSEEPFNCYFELLHFERNGEFYYFIVFCAECWIMNEAGQTVDSFNC